MYIDDAFWQYSLLLANALLLGAAALVIVRLRRELHTMREFWTSPAMAAMQPEPYDDRDLRRMFDRRLTMLQKYVEQQVAARPNMVAESPAAVAPRSNELPVEYATRMARAGASEDDLVRGCGLNKGEAQLLMRLHAGRTSATQAITH
ncbi:DUF2802 domain-containing protein [Woeseia oceani]|uniref:DUF2802 domain-containing protein n=1 Tax=Woeseia oceani TaxID=1548547 RepID=A0A193LFA6_9GAMM|nr:DUF2802 domain-containing protein [Woeseia oceani]ANO51064.1 hypothetical protein BA177_07440 [Woeseia oceani]